MNLQVMFIIANVFPVAYTSMSAVGPTRWPTNGYQMLFKWLEQEADHSPTRVYLEVSGLSHNEINNNNEHSLRSNTKCYGSKTR
jgi:hypothetical protein